MRQIWYRQPCFYFYTEKNGRRKFWYWHEWGIYRKGLRFHAFIPPLYPFIPEMDQHFQYTGHDIDGINIFEGDILCGEYCGYSAPKYYIVTDSNCGLYLRRIADKHNVECDYAILERSFETLEIIGNIVENPELLEVKND